MPRFLDSGLDPIPPPTDDGKTNQHPIITKPRISISPRCQIGAVVITPGVAHIRKSQPNVAAVLVEAQPVLTVLGAVGQGEVGHVAQEEKASPVVAPNIPSTTSNELGFTRS